MLDRTVSSCPSLEETELFVQQGTDERIRRHVEECPACRQLVHEIQANNSLIGAFRAAAHDQPEAAFSSIPERIGGYRLLREIHRGGQGIVYKAVHIATRRIVAIKMLAAGSLASPRQRNRFEREIEIIAGMRHANLVTLFETLELPDARTAFAMEFVDGLTLDKWLDASAASVTDRLRLFMTICEAVSYAHQHGIIHRDIKPGNILVDQDDRPHILDFGLAKALGSEQLNQTRTGEFLGTFAYAAPEQVQGDPQQIDTRTDVYALGMILYEMLADCRPYPESGPLSDMLRYITRVDPPRPSQFKRGLDDELDTIVCKALAKEPARRYQSVGALAADVQHYLDGQPLDAKRDSAWYMVTKTVSRYRGALTLAVLGVLVLAAVAIIMSVLYERTSVAERGLADKSRELSRMLSASNVERAKLMLRTGNVPLAERLLWGEMASRSAELLSGGSRPRDPAYWALWELYSENPCRATFRHEGSRVGWVQFDDEERRLRAVSLDGRITQIDFASGSESLVGQASDGGKRWELTFQRVGDEYLFVDDQGRLVAENAETLARTAEIELSPESVVTATVSGDRRRIAWVGADGRITMMNLQSRQRLIAPASAAVAGTGMVRPVFSADGAFLLTTGADRSLCLWDLGAEIKLRWRQSLDSPATTLALSHDQRSIAVSTLGEKGARILLWAVADGLPISVLPGHMAKVSTLEFSKDDRRLLSCSYDKSVRLWDVAAARELRQFLGHSDLILKACFSPSERWIVSTAIDGMIKVWENDPPAARIYEANRPVMSAAYSPDGNEIVCTIEGGDIHAWRPDGSQPERRFSAHSSSVPHVAFLPSGELVTGDYAGRLLFWDFKNAQVLADADASDLSSINYVGVSRDGRWLATAHQVGKVRLFDAKTRQPVRTWTGRPFRCPVVEFSPDSRFAVGGFTDGTVIAWDVQSGEVSRSWHAHEAAVRTLIFSHDGKTLATGGDDWSIKLWDFAGGDLLRKLEGHKQDVFGLAFSADGRFLASCDRGASILLWDVQSGQNLAHLPGHRDMVFSVVFSPDDRCLATASIDHTVRVQDLDYYRQHMRGNLAAAARAKE